MVVFSLYIKWTTDNRKWITEFQKHPSIIIRINENNSSVLSCLSCHFTLTGMNDA